MSEAQHQLLITLVHGTWPRGPFPRFVRFKQRVRELTRRQRSSPPPFWFEEGSPFLTRLCNELGDLPHKITSLPWSGKNSIRARDEAGRNLAKHLSAEHATYPQAPQLIIAHSHGGNIALRALYQLQQHDASQLPGSEKQTPLVVTLATPFIEVHHADLGLIPTRIRMSVAMVIWILLCVLMRIIFSLGQLLLISFGAILVLFSFTPWYVWSERATSRRQDQVEALRDATRLGEIASDQAKRLLIVRAIDDEASLLLALGTIVNYVMTRSIPYVRWIVAGPFSIALTLLLMRQFNISPLQQEWYENAIQIGCCAFVFILLGLLSIARTVHGSELAVSPMECQINTQSAPDAVGLSKMVTLVRRTYVMSLRHGIYDHEDCAKEISDWVRSRLCVPTTR